MSQPSGSRHRRAATKILSIASLATAIVVFSGATLAQGRGGGIGSPAPPHLADVTCMETCAGLRSAAVGSKVALTGESLAAITEVSFNRKDGDGRIGVAPDSVAPGQVVAKIPDGAATGKARVADGYGQSADSPVEIEIVSPAEAEPSGPFRLAQAGVTAPKVFFAGKKRAQVQFMFNGDSAQDVRVEVVNRDDRSVVRTLVVSDVQPGAPASANWNGLSSGREVAPSGNYKFRLSPISGGEGEDGDGATNFEFYGFKFPISRGKHTYGDGVGADRGDHTHAGQDVLADCGLPLVAVRAGTIQAQGYNGGAGNYLVIDGKNDDHDYVYMHLLRPALVRKGDRVKTGQRVGTVGSTGSSTACHLHFEIWTAPGWYEGGEPMFEVTKILERWDTWS